jgi:hypothetical protein
MSLLVEASLVFSSPSPCTRVLDGRLDLCLRGLLGTLVGLGGRIDLGWDLLRRSGLELGRSRPSGPRVERGGHPGPRHEARRCSESGRLGSVALGDLGLLLLCSRLLLRSLLDGLLLRGHWWNLLLCMLLGLGFLDLAGRGGGGRLLLWEGTRH